MTTRIPVYLLIFTFVLFTRIASAIDEQREWDKEDALKGIPKAQCAWATWCMLDAKDDFAKSECVKWYIAAAEQGDRDAATRLLEYYIHKNKVESYKWSKVAVAINSLPSCAPRPSAYAQQEYFLWQNVFEKIRPELTDEEIANGDALAEPILQKLKRLSASDERNFKIGDLLFVPPIKWSAPCRYAYDTGVSFSIDKNTISNRTTVAIKRYPKLTGTAFDSKRLSILEEWSSLIAQNSNEIITLDFKNKEKISAALKSENVPRIKSESEFPGKQSEMEIAGRKIKIYEKKGTYKEVALSEIENVIDGRGGRPDYSLIGAIIESKRGNIFLMLVGPNATVASAKLDFHKMIEDAILNASAK